MELKNHLNKKTIRNLIIITTILFLSVLGYYSYNIHNQNRIKEVEELRNSIPAPELIVEYHEYNQIDENRRFLVIPGKPTVNITTNCETVIFDHVVREEELEYGDPIPMSNGWNSVISNESGGGYSISEDSNSPLESFKQKSKKLRYMYCKVSWFKPFQSRKEAVIGKKYTTLDYQKIVSDYENKVEGIKIR